MPTLANVLAGPKGGSFSSIKQFRKYAATLTTETLLQGVPDRSDKRILYEVGVRHPKKGSALAAPPDRVVATNVAYDSSNVTSALFEGLAKKHSNFTTNFEVSNLAGIVVRVARGLACDSAYSEGVSASDLLAGRPLRVQALGAVFSPTSASEETVFIPRIVDTIITPDVFAVLAHAICGEGGSVATDCLQIDATTRAAVVPSVDDYAFAPAAVDALRLLGANMAACGQGELFATCLVKGLNDVLTVVGHTDEGGVLRDVMRSTNVGSPFGGIHVGLVEYSGLPSLATCDSRSVAGYVDSLLLSSAGLVAHCDPGIEYNGKWYPTILTASKEGAGYLPPGRQAEPQPWMAASNKSSLLRVFSRFAINYTRALAKLFGLEPNGGPAHGMLLSGAENLEPDNRHLRMAVCAPFFWVEPTSLIAHDFCGLPAEREGYGAVATKHRWNEKPLWERAARVGDSEELASSLAVRFRTARTSGFLTHFWGHANDGVAFARVMQMDAVGVLLPGPSPHPTVADTVTNGGTLAQLLWTRGQSPLPAPAELTNLGGTLGLRIQHMGMDNEGYTQRCHVPAADEIVGGVVHCTVSGLKGLDPGDLTEHTRDARRARTLAGKSLTLATTRMHLYGSPVATDMQVSLTAPTLPDETKDRREVVFDHPAEEGRGTSTTQGAPAHEPTRGQTLSGSVAAVMEHAADRGPKVAQHGGAVAKSGTANAPPAPQDSDAVSVSSATGPTPQPETSSAAAQAHRADDL